MSRIPLPRAILFYQAILGLSLAALPLTAGEEESAARTGFEVECPRCGLSGRITCPTCGGGGNLWKPCTTCGGKGRRPCPQCSVPGSDSRLAATPGTGKVSCTSCGGKGTLEGNPVRPCFRCRGTRELTCQVCFGKGDLRCPKTRYHRTCPTCSFVGTVPCPDCRGGEDPVGAQRTASRSSQRAATLEVEPPLAVASTPVKATRHRDISPAERKAAADLWSEIDQSFTRLKALMALEPGEELRQARRLLGRLQREALDRAGERGAGEVAVHIRESQREVQSLERRWAKVIDHFERLEKYHRRAKPLWESQSKLFMDLTASEDLEAAREKLALLQRWLTLAQSSLRALSEEKPDQLVEAIKAAGLALLRSLEETRVVRSGGRLAEPETPLPEAELLSGPAKLRPEARELESLGSAAEEPPVGTPARENPASGASREKENSLLADLPALLLGLLAIALCAFLYVILARREQPPTPERS